MGSQRTTAASQPAVEQRIPQVSTLRVIDLWPVSLRRSTLHALNSAITRNYRHGLVNGKVTPCTAPSRLPDHCHQRRWRPASDCARPSQPGSFLYRAPGISSCFSIAIHGRRLKKNNNNNAIGKPAIEGVRSKQHSVSQSPPATAAPPTCLGRPSMRPPRCNGNVSS